MRSKKFILINLLFLVPVVTRAQVEMCFAGRLEYYLPFMYSLNNERIDKNKNDHSFYHINDGFQVGLGAMVNKKIDMTVNVGRYDFGHKVYLLSIDKSQDQRHIIYVRKKYLHIGFTGGYYFRFKHFTLVNRISFDAGKPYGGSLIRDKTEYESGSLGGSYYRIGTGIEAGKFFGRRWWGLNVGVYLPEFGSGTQRSGNLNFNPRSAYYYGYDEKPKGPSIYINRMAASCSIVYRHCLRFKKQKSKEKNE